MRTEMPIEMTFSAIRAFLRDESGPTTVEYAVMLAMILMAIIAGIGTLGSSTGSLYGDIQGDMDAHGIN
ncbi:Flp/Fap pilin component [Stratiformator vulcanicus]|uniref:Flp/Fap pilin component n=2 Tax=Stratiformator vulcanicus TaxID=2527980 RepID=A0A517R7Q2_9PLAN|nr:Flp/Fap pilin component [Stratiformator vulcanicus]